MGDSLRADEFRSRLQAHGLRVTRPRMAVLDFLGQNPHTTVEEIASGVRGRLTSVSTQAVYDVLGVLTEIGILRRMEPAGSAARYEVMPRDAHQHLVCRSCGDIVDVAIPPVPAAGIGQAHGYLVQDIEVTIWGVCPRCHPAENNPPKE